MKNTVLQFDEDLLNKIKIFAKQKGQTENDFINDLIKNALINHHVLLTGGFILTVPNPQFYHVNTEQALACICKVENTSKFCTQANIPNGLSAYADFLKARLFTDSQDRRDYFKTNLELRTSAESTQSDK